MGYRDEETEIASKRNKLGLHLLKWENMLFSKQGPKRFHFNIIITAEGTMMCSYESCDYGKLERIIGNVLFIEGIKTA